MNDATQHSPATRHPLRRARAGGRAAWLLRCTFALCALGLYVAPAHAASGVAAQGPRDSRALRLAQPRALAPFTLLDQKARPFRSSEAFRGRVSLVFFGFLNCPDVCPTTLLRLRNLMAADPELAAVQVVMISVDGERDTPAAMKGLLDAIEPRFVGLTGDPARVRPVARSFSASFVKQPPSGPDGAYVVDHSAQLYLVDRAGRLSTIFFNAPDAALRDALRAALATG